MKKIYIDFSPLAEVIQSIITDVAIKVHSESGDNNHTTVNSIGSNNVTAETYTYDARGNITGGFNHLKTGTCMVYNDANRLQEVMKNADITEYYQYDGSGQRVRKVNFNDDGDIVKHRKYIGSYEVYTESAAWPTIRKRPCM